MRKICFYKAFKQPPFELTNNLFCTFQKKNQPFSFFFLQSFCTWSSNFRNTKTVWIKIIGAVVFCLLYYLDLVSI